MIELVFATLYALAISMPMSIGLGFLYYFLAVMMMNVARRVWGEKHRGYYFLNLVVVLLLATFLLLFSFFARSF